MIKVPLNRDRWFMLSKIKWNTRPWPPLRDETLIIQRPLSGAFSLCTKILGFSNVHKTYINICKKVMKPTYTWAKRSRAATWSNDYAVGSWTRHSAKGQLDLDNWELNKKKRIENTTFILYTNFLTYFWATVLSISLLTARRTSALCRSTEILKVVLSWVRSSLRSSLRSPPARSASTAHE